jgi:fumarylacetoacetase
MKSFITYDKDSHFPIENIPFGVGLINGEKRIVTAIGDKVLNLSLLEIEGKFSRTLLKDKKVFHSGTLNDFMECGKKVWTEIRNRIQVLLDAENPELRDNENLRDRCFHMMKDVEMVLPVNIGDYTDFYSSREHASNVGEMFRGKENALMPNWLHIPIAYHGRSSSIIISGEDIRRPKGQTRPEPNAAPVFGASKQMDFELEMGFFIGTGNKLGENITVENAEEHIFGMVVVNDWSARDIQAWEYQPLGPFLAKNFATSISPWVVTLDALQPFRTEGPVFEKELLPYLQTKGNPSFDINLEVKLQSVKMDEALTICKSNYKYLYYNMSQHLAHHTVNGCNTRTGDIMASGTISGTTKDSRGSMLEITWRGTEPIKLPSGEERKFIEDGDTVIISAFAKGENFTVGFGEVKAKLLPAS